MRIPTLVGLLAGLLVGALVLGAIAMNLGSTNLEPPPASLALASSSPSPSVDPSPSATPSASSTAAGSAGPPRQRPDSGADAPIAVGLKVGQQAPGLTVARVGGGTVELAACAASRSGWPSRRAGDPLPR